MASSLFIHMNGREVGEYIRHSGGVHELVYCDSWLGLRGAMPSPSPCRSRTSGTGAMRYTTTLTTCCPTVWISGIESRPGSASGPTRLSTCSRASAGTVSAPSSSRADLHRSTLRKSKAYLLQRMKLQKTSGITRRCR